MATKKTSTKERLHEGQDEEQEATHVLELLAADVGEPPRSSLKAILSGTTDADLVSVGKTILSSRIVLDRADGINILIMGQIIRAFDGAHGIDPTIPRLVPISTRRLFNRNTRKKADPGEPPQAGGNAPSLGESAASGGG